MYRISDKRSAISQIQNYLIGLGGFGLHIVPSGVYDENTREAVRRFQAESTTTESGTVDYATHKRLAQEYRKRITSDVVKEKVYPRLTFPLSLGYYGDGMRDVNLLLGALLDHYGIYHTVYPGKYYSRDTASAVSELRRIMSMGASDSIDEALYDRMIKEEKSINIFKQMR